MGHKLVFVRLRAAGVVISLAVAASIGFAAPAAEAAPAATLCAMDTSRGSVPAGFPVDACVDASSIWVRNTLSAPVQLTVTGDTQAPVQVASAPPSPAADATRARYPSPLLLLAGDEIRIPFGSGAASVTVENTDAAGFYATALAAQPFVAAGTTAADVAALVDRVVAAYADVARCLAGASADSASCRGQLARGVAAAVTHPGVAGVSSSAVSTLHDWAAFTSWESRPSLGSDRTISISARSVPSPLAGLRYHAVFTATPYVPVNAVCDADPLFAHGYGDQFSLEQLSPSSQGLTLVPQTGFLPYSIVFLQADQQVTYIGVAALDLYAADGTMLIENAFGTSVGSCGGPPVPAGVSQSFHTPGAYGIGPACGTLVYTREGDTFTVDVAYTDC